MFGIVVAIALPFAVIAGLMASLITYDEMQHHFDHKRAVMEAAKTGAVAFVIIVSLSIIAASGDGPGRRTATSYGGLRGGFAGGSACIGPDVT